MGGDPKEMEEKFNFEHRISEEMRIFKSVNGQSFTSWVQHEKVKELCNYDSDNIEIIPPGVDIHKFYPATANDKPNPELPDDYVYCISRLDTNKGHDLLLRSFKYVLKEHPDMRLVIGGGSPNPKPRELDLVAKLQGIIDEEGIGERVTMIGYVADDEMPPNYQFSRFFVLPSLFEPFGMTTQEAMACGRSVIASKFGGIRNVIDNGVNGYLVDPTKPEEFAGVMNQLIENRDVAEEVGRKAHQLTLEQFSWEAIAERHLEFFRKYFDRN
jgi:mannosylfructose-phosphate synthase